MGAIVDMQSATVKELNRATSDMELHYMSPIALRIFPHNSVLSFHIILCDSHDDKFVSSGP